MILTFVHDHIFYEYKNRFYSPGRFTDQSWQRYFAGGQVKKINVVCRCLSLSKLPDGLVIASAPNVHFLPVPGVSGGYQYYTKAYLIRQHLISVINSSDFVVIRVPSHLGSAAFSVCKKLNKVFSCEVVGCAWDSSWFHGSLSGKILALFKYLHTRNAVSQSVGNLYVTKFFLQRRYPSKSLYTSSASNVFLAEQKDKVLKERIVRIEGYSPSTVFKLGILSNVELKYKGIDVAIKSIAYLKNRYPTLKVSLVIAGGGSPSSLKKLVSKLGVENEVRFRGQIQLGSKVFDFLDDIDIFLQPSLTEGLPRSVIEAMSRGCPVLGSSAGGIPELISNKFLHKPADYKKLAHHIHYFLTNFCELTEQAKENFDRSSNYSEQKLIDERNRFYSGLFKLNSS